MRQNLALLTAPAAEPVTLAEVKGFARIDATTEDALLTTLIATAREAAELFLRRSLITQSWTLTLDMGGGGLDCWLPSGTYDLPVSALYGDLPRSFHLPMGKVQSVTSVKTYDTSNTESTYSSANYTLNSDTLILNSTAYWPSNLRERATCVIEYVAGYGDTASSIPQAIRTGILMHIAALYDTRGQCEGATDMPPGAKQLMARHRVLGERRG